MVERFFEATNINDKNGFLSNTFASMRFRTGAGNFAKLLSGKKQYFVLRRSYVTCYPIMICACHRPRTKGIQLKWWSQADSALALNAWNGKSVRVMAKRKVRQNAQRGIIYKCHMTRVWLRGNMEYSMEHEYMGIFPFVSLPPSYLIQLMGV